MKEKNKKEEKNEDKIYSNLYTLQVQLTSKTFVNRSQNPLDFCLPGCHTTS